MSLNPYAAPSPPPSAADLPTVPRIENGSGSHEEWVRQYRQVALLTVLVAAFTQGVVTGSSSLGQALAALGFASAVTLWCSLDAYLHGKLFLRSFGWALMFTWPIGVAVHLVWTRGARGLLTYALAGVACIGAAVAGAGAAGFLISR